MRIGIDLDGVCHDLVGSYRRFLEEDCGHAHPTPEPTEWDFCESWGITRERFLGDLDQFVDPIFDGDMLPGTLGALLDLYDAGHEISFITHRPLQAWDVTERWLDRFEVLHVGRLHFVEHKHTVDVDVHIDDHLDTATHMAVAGIRSFLFDRPWNQGEAPDVTRVTSWDSFIDAVEQTDSRSRVGDR